ncbi:hypothetical protein ACFQ61_08220 [Streptomyces sp. NPDC056500]|uniref:hypothetical protein n=1 Tax=Streptomyces sp. NPDC056500 TaxID=3345840 RepID=UPI0036C4ABB3
MPLIALTRCRNDWPRRYRSYYQETRTPFRRSEPATVYRLGTRGIVVGRWTSQADSEQQALADALGARPTPLLGPDGLLPNYRDTEAGQCSPADPQKMRFSKRPERGSPR